MGIGKSGSNPVKSVTCTLRSKAAPLMLSARDWLRGSGMAMFSSGYAGLISFCSIFSVVLPAYAQTPSVGGEQVCFLILESGSSSVPSNVPVPIHVQREIAEQRCQRRDILWILNQRENAKTEVPAITTRFCDLTLPVTTYEVTSYGFSILCILENLRGRHTRGF